MENNELVEELGLDDIADKLLIVNKYTIDKLFKLEECSDCIALYMFYYKTAKWQKTNRVKVNDTYAKACLHWGSDKITKIKNILKTNGLIETVQVRKDGKISGWYVRVHYYVSEKKIEDIKIKVEEEKATTPHSKNLKKQEVVNSSSCSQETNAYDNNIYAYDNNTSSSSYIGTSPTQDQLITFLEENGFYLSPIQYETILTWLNYDFDLIKYVVRNALNDNKLNIKYIDKVLFNLSRKNIKTVKQAEEDNRQFEEQKERQREEKRRNNYHYMTETEKANKEQEDFETMLDRVGNELQEKGIIK